MVNVEKKEELECFFAIVFKDSNVCLLSEPPELPPRIKPSKPLTSILILETLALK